MNLSPSCLSKAIVCAGADNHLSASSLQLVMILHIPWQVGLGASCMVGNPEPAGHFFVLRLVSH